MITDPMTIPRGRAARVVYAVSVGLLATLLIAPQTTEYATKVAVLSALALVCLFRPLLEWLLPAADSGGAGMPAWVRGLTSRGRVATGGLAIAAAAGFAGLVVVAGVPARPGTATAGALPAEGPIPQVSVIATNGVSARVDPATARQIAGDVVADLQAEADALRLRDPDRATVGAGGSRLVDLREQIGAAAGSEIAVPSYRVASVGLTLSRAEGQAPPRIVATIKGTEQVATTGGSRRRSSNDTLRRPSSARSRSRSSRAGT